MNRSRRDGLRHDPAARPSGRLKRAAAPNSDDGSDVVPTVSLPRSGNPRPARARATRARLLERDLQILRSLADFRLLTGRQLGQLHVQSSNPLTAARRSRAVLRRLTELGVISRLERRVGGIRAGSEGHVYGLSGLGRAVLAQGGQTVHGRTVWETRPDFQDHLLAIGELYVGLRQQERRTGETELLDFQTEPTAWRSFSGPAGERLPLKPDAFVVLGIGDYEQRAFVEIDRGTESLPTLLRKCRRYLAYWRTGDEQRHHGIFPRVWWLLDEPRRLTRLANQIARFASDEQQLFCVGLAADGPRLLASSDGDGDRS